MKRTMLLTAMLLLTISIGCENTNAPEPVVDESIDLCLTTNRLGHPERWEQWINQGPDIPARDRDSRPVDPGHHDKTAFVKGSEVEGPGWIGISNVEGEVGDIVAATVSFWSDGRNEQADYNKGVSAITIDMKYSEKLRFVGVRESLGGTHGWWFGSSDLPDHHGIRFGGCECPGTTVKQSEGEVQIVTLEFEIVEAGAAQFEWWFIWDHLWYYESHTPAPARSRGSQMRLCPWTADSGGWLGGANDMKYTLPGDSHFFGVMYNYFDNPVESFSLTMHAPEHVEFFDVFRYACTEGFETFDVTYSNDMRTAHVVADLGDGYVGNQYNWMMLFRVRMLGIEPGYGQLVFTDLGGDLQEVPTVCNP